MTMLVWFDSLPSRTSGQASRTDLSRLLAKTDLYSSLANQAWRFIALFIKSLLWIPCSCAIMSTMEIDILFDEGFENCLDENWLRKIIESALKAENAGDNAEMSLLITGQEKIHRLNKEYRGKDKPTDVLSFAMQDELQSEDGEGVSFIAPPDGIEHLGEVIISYPQAEIQAVEHDHSVEKEVAVLAIHGVLHLLGYDHIEYEEAEEMEAREKTILESVAGEF